VFTDRVRPLLAGPSGLLVWPIDWNELRELTFEKPDYVRFPAIPLAYEVARTGGTAPAIYNAANEVAVAAFLKRAIGFTEIADIVKKTLDRLETVANPMLDDILNADQAAGRQHSNWQDRPHVD
jgi:1-deoxy-D-xylulose-5-phosphate reductoisomerase